MADKPTYEVLEQKVKELEKEALGLRKVERDLRIYKTAVESSINAIVITDLEGKLIYVNDSCVKMWGYNIKDEILGRFLPEFWEGDGVFKTIKELHEKGVASGEDVGKRKDGSFSAILKDLIKTGKPCHDFETKRYTKDGHLLDVSISASRYDDHEGNPIGILAILRNISESKRLEAQLRYFDRIKAIGTLAGGIAHDFNNLMMGMLGNLSMVLFDIDSTHPHYEKLKTIDKHIQSGSKLTGQLLAYARKGTYEVRPISLNQLVKDTSDTFGRTKKEIRIHTELAEDLLAVKADEVQIEQVLINLYINAAHAMPDGGNLFLKTMNSTHKEMKGKPYVPIPGNYVLLKVVDQGTGIDKKIIDRIFEPFFTTKQMGRGTGLGLASVYGIIKSHGGYIDVDSKKGHGTTFSVFLPASDESIQQNLNISEQIIKGSEIILLVDDEKLVLDVGVQLLEKLGYDVLEAKSGKKAISVYKEKKDKIDLVILDVIMPEMTGEETFYKLKKINPKVKTLLSSGYTINRKATEMMEKGCNGFIQKPFSMEALSQKIREILDKE